MDVLDATFLAAATALDQLPAPTFAEVAFAGRSNVGKSSLINSLVGRKGLVRTSGAPGCTRSINLFRVRLRTEAASEVHLDLVDLPGYGYAQRSKAERRSWGPLIEGFLQERPGLRGLALILDVRRGIESDDSQLLEFVEHLPMHPIVVATKLDKLAKSKRKPAIRDVQQSIGRPVWGYSAATGEGRDRLWKRILEVCSVNAEASRS